MSTPLSDLPLPPGQNMPDMSGGAQQQYDLNSMIDAAASSQHQPSQDDPSISAGALQYQMDPSQIPFNGPNPNIQIQEDQMMDNQPMQYEMMQQYMEQEPELSFVQKITNEVKIPLIVAVLFVILSLPQFNKVLTKFVPRLLSETGDLNMMGLVAKSIIIAILVLIAKLFL
jgi:hypothetical protein